MKQKPAIYITKHAKSRIEERIGHNVTDAFLLRVLASPEKSDGLTFVRTRCRNGRVVRLYEGYIYAFDLRFGMKKLLTVFPDEGAETARMSYGFNGWAEGRITLEQ